MQMESSAFDSMGKKEIIWGFLLYIQPPVLSEQLPYNKTSISAVNSNKLHLNLAFVFPLVQFSSVTLSCPTLRPRELQHARLPCPSPIPEACSNLCPSSQWCHPTISSCRPLLLLPSVIPRSFPLSQLFASGGQSIGDPASAPVLPVNIQGLFPLGLTGLVSHSRHYGRTNMVKESAPQTRQHNGDSWTDSRPAMVVDHFSVISRTCSGRL